MKHVPNIIGAILGLAFIAFGINFFIPFMPSPPTPPEGSPAAMFFGSIYMTGFLTFIKVLEIIGGLLVIAPTTRNLGLLFLGPIVVGIIAVNVFIIGGGAVFQVPVIAISVFSAYLLWNARCKLSSFVCCCSKSESSCSK